MTESLTASHQTRQSLLDGMQAGSDERWLEFFRVYTPLLRAFAIKAGCKEVEAEEVVQETAIAVARHLPDFQLDPARCRFKTWLLNQASWRIKDQIRRRRRWEDRVQTLSPSDDAPGKGSAGDAIAEASMDGASAELESLWDAEWKAGLMEEALQRIRGKVSDRQYQIFDLNVIKGWPAREVARCQGITLASVYLAKHRVSSLLKRTVARLESAEALLIATRRPTE